ncbi:MAG: alpha-L-fucosidase [Clostridiales bacterium]|jgi:alpha-L-fucosidase|nr:alpha-L-fucosidase [Clostridiales bacterium]
MSDIYTSVTPNRRQKLAQEIGFYAFVHFSVNTFTGREWGTGRENPAVFNPKRLDAEQWCRAIKAAEMKGVVLTAKHHDGFCLWRTETTEHCVKNSPYKNGGGDVVAELSAACEKYGLKFGIYLSPWDRNCPLYGADKYTDFYIRQLTELLTGYGKIFMLWIDGACGAALDGKPEQEYDFERIYATALKYQPDIILSNCAPDVRWVGNEKGRARESEWNVVPEFDFGKQNFKKTQALKRCEDVLREDMGSREFLSGFDKFIWYPAEADVSIRPGWFYHPRQNFAVKKTDELMRVYYGTAGGNCLLLLNIPPDRNGLFHKKDVKRLEEIGGWIRRENALEIKLKSAEYAGGAKDGSGAENLLCGGVFSPEKPADSYELTLRFDRRAIDRARIAEDTDFSQRVEKFEISTIKDGMKKKLFSGTVIGFNKIAIFEETETDNLIIDVTRCRGEPYLKTVKVYGAGAWRDVRKPFRRMFPYKKL